MTSGNELSYIAAAERRTPGPHCQFPGRPVPDGRSTLRVDTTASALHDAAHRPADRLSSIESRWPNSSEGRIPFGVDVRRVCMMSSRIARTFDQLVEPTSTLELPAIDTNRERQSDPIRSGTGGPARRRDGAAKGACEARALDRVGWVHRALARVAPSRS